MLESVPYRGNLHDEYFDLIGAGNLAGDDQANRTLHRCDFHL